MNLLHLKYAVEVEKTGSITKAAERLYMGQPNLSKSIRELEEGLGITIFKRTSKGVIPTREGAKFLGYAKSIVASVEEVEGMYSVMKNERLTFSAAVPRAAYIAAAFVNFLSGTQLEKELDFSFMEANTQTVMNRVAYGDSRLGIIRYQTIHENYFKSQLAEKGLCGDLLWEFSSEVLMHRDCPLSSETLIAPEALAGCVEVSYGDVTLPPSVYTETPDSPPRRISVFTRSTAYETLRTVADSYMLASPEPKDNLEKLGLISRPLLRERGRYRDMIITLEDTSPSELEDRFIYELYRIRDSL